MTNDADLIPASKRVAAALRAAIDNGTHPPGSRLPSYRDLAHRHGVALNTAREAVRILADERRVRVRHGVGVDVREDTEPEPELDGLRTLRDELRTLRRQLDDCAAAIRKIERQINEITDES